MQNLLFVHGTGVRESGYKLALEFVTSFDVLDQLEDIPQVIFTTAFDEVCYQSSGELF
jgi:hypothetical protein